MQPLTVVLSSELAAGGLDSHALAREVAAGARRRLRRRVVSTAPLPDGATELAVAVAAGAQLVAPGVVSHLVAARVHGFAAVPLGGPVCVTRPGRTGSRRAGTAVRVHLHCAGLGPEDVVVVAGVAVTSPARTVVDLARMLSPPRALAVADAALATGVVSGEALASVLQAQVGWPGGGRARRVVTTADPGAESPLESAVRWALAGVAGSGEPPVLQLALTGASGRRYRVDLCWPARRTVVEVDGRVKYDDPRRGSARDALWAEKRREDDLREAGWEVVRVVAADLVHDGSALRARVRAAFARGASRGSPSAW